VARHLQPALLAGYRREWVVAAEALADLGDDCSLPNASTVFLFLYLPGLDVSSGRDPAEFFVHLDCDEAVEVVQAERVSLEAMSGRHPQASYLSHVQGLVSFAARRVAAWTIAARYEDPNLAVTLLEQLSRVDPSNRACYVADVQNIRANQGIGQVDHRG
jgi:hypothetical protein